MIIDGIRLYSAAESSTPAELYAEFSLSHADMSQSYIIQEGSGFDLDDVTPYFYGTFGMDNYVQMRVKERNIVLKLRLNPQLQDGETPSSLRDNLYKVIAKGRTGLVDLRLMNEGEPVAHIYGMVNKFEVDIFSPEPAVQLAIKCEDPIFRGFYDVTPTVDINNAAITDDVSTAPHGFNMVILFNANVASPFIIQGKGGTNEWPFQINYPFLTNDLLHMTTTDGARQLYVIRSGVTTQLMDKIALGQVWPQIFPGDNLIDFPNVNITMQSFTYKHHFWGV